MKSIQVRNTSQRCRRELYCNSVNRNYSTVVKTGTVLHSVVDPDPDPHRDGDLHPHQHDAHNTGSTVV